MNLYNFIAKLWRNEAGYFLKDLLRPVKHALVGKTGIHAVIEIMKKSGLYLPQDHTVIFDVGGAVGETAIPLRKAFPKAEIYAFEPNPVQFKDLDRRTKGMKIDAYRMALSATLEDQLLCYDPAHPDAGTLLHPDAFKVGAKGYEKKKWITTPSMPLDQFCEEEDIRYIDLLKIDVEGWEKMVLIGAQRMLMHTRFVYVEISQNWYEVMTILKGAGFELVGNVGDYLFKRSEKIDKTS